MFEHEDLLKVIIAYGPPPPVWFVPKMHSTRPDFSTPELGDKYLKENPIGDKSQTEYKAAAVQTQLDWDLEYKQQILFQWPAFYMEQILKAVNK